MTANCSDCGKLLEEVDFASGRAHYVDGTAYCWDCRSSMTSEPPKLIVTMSPVTKRAIADPRVVQSKQRKRLLIAGGAGLASLFLLVAFLASRKPTPTPAMSIVSFALISAETRKPITGFDTLAPGAVITLSSLPTRKIEIEARTAPATVGSVRFGLDQEPNLRIEERPPYSFAAEQFLVPGEHTVTATPFSKAGAQGEAGPALMIRLTIKE